ncbi:MAG: hypothetical protein WAV95_15940 [Azonexus sp.]
MEIEESTVKKITIRNVQNLDPVAVMVEDFGPGEGKITITCFGEAWSHYWSHMGETNKLADFFCSCGEHYLAGKLKTGIRDEVDDDDPEALTALMRKEIIKDRREGDISKGVARERWNKAEGYDSRWDGHELLYEVFGDEYWYCTPKKPNHEYEYLCRIIKTVQAALSARRGG